ncbi:efflux RND transporter periplasmic adaptor subunit [Thiobacillus sp.]|uniref:efflux RND transporter periplasmic adaptor subunit n=1 Tax=Thiobacillus sp. TaxID=924 RepID=UPI00286DD800|nr:efflux RND transporter periplasmic adaptor subunit [Thiobacillus sp.]
MKPGTLKISPRTLTLALGALAFIAAFVWLLTTRGPLAPVGVEIVTVTQEDLDPGVYGIGTVEARHAYAVGPIQAGRLLRVRVDQGDRVRAGQLLAEMDPVDLRQRGEAAASAVARARQTALAAQAQVAEAESRARLAEANSARYQMLVNQKFIAQEMADSRHHEAAAANAALAAARASAAGAQRDIGRAEAELQGIDQVRDSLKLLSPIDGVVTAREAEPGTTVVAGQAVLRLVDPAALWVRARVDQARARGIAVGQAADIVLRSAPGVTLPGKVARIELQSDAVTEERLVSVVFAPPPAQLYLGELAEVTIRQPGARGVLSVPRAALARVNSQTGVWQAVNGRARFRPVRIGLQSAERSQIVSGLDAGEKVIVYSAKQLDDDMRVREQQLGQP